MFGPTGEEVTGDWKNCNTNLKEYISSNVQRAVIFERVTEVRILQTAGILVENICNFFYKSYK
jgi:hypothetical protein